MTGWGVGQVTGVGGGTGDWCGGWDRWPTVMGGTGDWVGGGAGDWCGGWDG